MQNWVKGGADTSASLNCYNQNLPWFWSSWEHTSSLGMWEATSWFSSAPSPYTWTSESRTRTPPRTRTVGVVRHPGRVRWRRPGSMVRGYPTASAAERVHPATVRTRPRQRSAPRRCSGGRVCWWATSSREDRRDVWPASGACTAYSPASRWPSFLRRPTTCNQPFTAAFLPLKTLQLIPE